MSYSFDAQFPTRETKDLQTLLRMLKEKYCRRFPMVYYKSILLPQEAASGAITTDKTKTVVDDLYGESVPQDLADGFQQPHTNVAIDATDTEKFENPLEVNVKIEFVPETKEIGSARVIDRKSVIEYVFLNVQFAELNAVIKPGDKFIWKDASYKVDTWNLAGRYAETDYFIYSRVRASTSQIGS